MLRVILFVGHLRFYARCVSGMDAVGVGSKPVCDAFHIR